MVFLSLDGVDGAGKSTQLERLEAWLREQGRDLVTCRDPGSTPLGESIREILLHRAEVPMHFRSEMLLYMAARAQLVEQVIRPALEAGRDVLSDRYLLANVVYQAHAGGLDVETTWSVGGVATGGLEPDLTIVLDVPVEIAAERRAGGEPDRLESRSTDYHDRVRQGFLFEASRRPKVRVVDATRSPEAIAAEIQSLVADVMAGD